MRSGLLIVVVVLIELQSKGKENNFRFRIFDFGVRVDLCLFKILHGVAQRSTELHRVKGDDVLIC